MNKSWGVVVLVGCMMLGGSGDGVAQDAIVAKGAVTGAGFCTAL